MRSDGELKKLLGDTEHDITDLQNNCNFSVLNNEHETHARGEVGLYCQRHTYTYHIGGAPSETNLVYTRQFSVVGAEKEAVTYLFDLTIGFEFAMAAQLKAVLQRTDIKNAGSFVFDPLQCLYDHSCVESD